MMIEPSGKGTEPQRGQTYTIDRMANPLKIWLDYSVKEQQLNE